MTLSIKATGIKDAIRNLEQLPKKFRASIYAGGLYLKGKVAKYPPPSGRSLADAGIKMTNAQRRWIFAALKRGEIPYKRGMSRSSQKLGQSWTVVPEDSGMSVRVGTRVTYAGYVMGGKNDPVQQAAYHRGTWKTSDEILAAEKEKTIRHIRNTLIKLLKR